MRNWILVLSALIIGSLFCLYMASMAFSAECITSEQAKALTLKTFQNAKIADIGPDETQAFLRAYNSAPPVSNYEGKTMLAIDVSELPKLIIYLFDDAGCGKWTIGMLRMDFMKLMMAERA